LTPLDRRIAVGMSTLALSNSMPTPKQTETALRIYQSAVAKGFLAESEI